MSGYLTTHVLDTARGMPAKGIKIELYNLDGDRTLIAQTITNDDGRGRFQDGQIRAGVLLR